MTRRTRQRFHIILVVIYCLLFQQMALAAYACSTEQVPVQAQAQAMGGHCAEMVMQQTQDNPALCAKHCAPDQATAADQVKLSVPALLLPPQFFAPVLMTPVAHVAVQADAPAEQSQPPPRLRYCSLLI
jgi:hypothetical protein